VNDFAGDSIVVDIFERIDILWKVSMNDGPDSA
jgi:hypothetical protein